ncbi:hypothetical protein HYT32_00190, partial [Candidatus Roizmanbacteria bacterium]|nr:hypothetical protein [Candidatus Roizmanbacteria bacterium]
VAANLERAFTIQNQATTNTTDNNVTALLWLDNADTSGTGSTVIQNAIHIQNSGNISGGIVNAIHIEDTDVTTDLKLQNGETIDNDVDGTIALTATTVSLSGSLSIGSNSIVTSGATISQAELDRLDGKDAALVDQNDLTSGDGAGGTSSGSGLEAGTGGIGLLQGCADNQILKWNEASSVWECASDRSTVAIVKSADESVANSTMQDDNELLFAVGTSETWAIDSNLVYTTGGSSSPDIKVAVNGPASSTCVYGVMSHAVATATNQNFGEISTCDTAVALATTATGERQVFIKGSVVTAGSTGNIAIRWAQNTSNATATVVETGSYLLGFKVSGADLAEVYYAKEGEDVSPGTVVSLDQSREAGVIKSQKPYDSNVLGIVSTRPGLVLGEGNRAGVPVFVALSGRVPIKVSGENGAIRPGDYLTASSIPGVAMKATRAGPIVGQALTSHVENGEGEVITFIKNGYFNGSLAAIPIPFESGEEVQTRGDPALGILSYFLNQRGDGPPGGAPIDMSEVVTDRLVAGLEVITPKLVAETAVLDKIQPATGEDVSLNLGANGRFVVKDGEEKEGVVFDSQGNAYIPGLLIANKIKANQIEGLEIFTNKLAKLEESEQKISTSEAGLVLGENTGNSSLDLEVTGQLISKGGLIVENKATFKEETVFEKLVTLLSNVIFRGEVSFEKVPTFSKDTAGFARIKRGERFVFVEFEKEYVNEPVVNATLYMPKFDQQAFEEKVVNGDCVLPTAATECQDRILSSILSDDIKYVITEKTSKGFVILLSKFAPQDISFTWSAIAVREPRTSDRNSLIDSRIFNIQTDSKSQEEPNLESSLPETSPTPALESTATSEAELN